MTGLRAGLRRAVTRWRMIGFMVLSLATVGFVALINTPRGPNTAGAQTAQTKIPITEFERRIRAYLLKHPEVIVEAMQRYEDRQRADRAKAIAKLLKSRADEILRDPASPVGGNPDGDVTVVEFFDYNCAFCRRVGPDMLKLEGADTKLRVVYKEFPILGPNSTFAAKAALAAHRQGKYVQLHRALLQGRGSVTETSVLKIAARLGMDIDRLKKDIADPAITAALARNIALASALGINGTPAFVIGQEIVPGAIDLAAMQQLVTKARGGK